MIETMECVACGEVFAQYMVRPQFACPECDHQHEVPRVHLEFLARQQKWTGDTRLMICAWCEQPAFWYDYPAGGWWVHVHHPNDDHEAQ